MKFGHFDLENKEYVITRPDTPAPWVNYLGSPEYGAIISNNAAGYSFVKSGASGRLTRFRFNSEMALPGRYIYIRDNQANDFWSNSWQPTAKSPDVFKSECRHGTAYTVISSTYTDIHCETTYYVPLNQSYEVWHTQITNQDTKPRDLSVFGFMEFTNDPHYEQDQVNLQYSLYISNTHYEDNVLTQTICENSPEDCQKRFFALANGSVDAYCGDLDHFLGTYHTYGDPVAVANGDLGNALNTCLNSCGALQTNCMIQPGQTITLTYLLGPGSSHAHALVDAYTNSKKAEQEIDALKTYWHTQLNRFQVHTPSDAFNNMINVWNAYQCFITFIWSRAASFLYCGLRNGYGYRDTVQDIQGIIHLNPSLAKEKIRFMLSAQVNNGAGLPLVKFHHNAGYENTPDDPEYVKETGHPSYRADDALWLFPTIWKYIGETGDLDFLKEEIVYANGGIDTVYEHMKKAIDFSLHHYGSHGMPAGLFADWNDCLRLGSQGESTFVAFQLYYAMQIMTTYARKLDDAEYIETLKKNQQALGQALASCWDDDRFIRGIRDNGKIVGAKQDAEANMWLNPQSWSVISGYASKEQSEKAMDSVYHQLNTPYGAKLMEPPYVHDYFDGALMHIYNLDCKENGGIFSQSQGWLILAEALLGHGNRAFQYFEETSPATMNERAEIRRMEPYVHGQFTESRRSPFEGRSHNHWLTGTASTVMVGCVEGICGLRPVAEGLIIQPSIPSYWDGFTMDKEFRGKQLHIHVSNPDHVQSGVKKWMLNGKTLDTSVLTDDMLEENNTIEVIMG